MKLGYFLLIILSVGSVYGQTTNLSTINSLSNSTPMKINVINPEKKITVKLVVPGSSGLIDQQSVKCQIENILAKEIFYKNGTIIHSFVIIHDPHTEKSYVFSSSNTNYFYISYKSGMVVCDLVGTGGQLSWHESYFEISESENIDVVATRFASVIENKEKLIQLARQLPKVFLSRVANPLFFTENSNGGASVRPTIQSIDLTNGILRLDLLSNGGIFAGSFWIDLQAKKVVKSVVKDLKSGEQVYPK